MDAERIQLLGGVSIAMTADAAEGIVKLTKSSVAQPQEIAIGRHCEHDT